MKRETSLVVIPSSNADQPQVFEIAPSVFDLLTALDGWVDIAALGAPEEAGELVTDLANLGLVEERR